MRVWAIIIILNIFTFIFQNIYKNVEIIFGLNMFFLENGFYWQILTSMFLHGNFIHLFMNMAVLFQFGSILEKAKGKLYFLILYIGGGLITSILTFFYIYFMNMGHLVIGASGAICVLMGYIAQKDKFNRNGLITVVLLISFAPILMGVNVAWYAHIFGFGVGYLAGLFLFG